VRIALVAGAAPNPTASGATLTTWTAARHFIEQGHEVVATILGYETYLDPLGATLDERTAAFTELGGRIDVVPSAKAQAWDGLETGTRSRISRLVTPEPTLLFPTLNDRRALEEALSRIAPDAIYAYHWEAVAASHGTRVAPRFGVVVDPSHAPLLHGWAAIARQAKPSALRMLPVVASALRISPRMMVELLNDCEASADLAAHHARWLRSRGATECRYMRTPVPDPFADGERRTRAARNEKPVLLLMGHLKGTSTLKGLELFGRETLPRLEAALGADGFSVRIVGGYELRESVGRLLDRPAVELCGHTDDPGAEFLGADMMVVPTGIKLGTRVRILTAFSYGCPVVAHDANALGIPELRHRENAVLASSGAGLAEGILAVAGSADLRARLEREGRATFERLFSPHVAGEAMLRVLEELAAPGPVAAEGGRRRPGPE
jgi:hypothetical protein